MSEPGTEKRRLLSIMHEDRLKRVLEKMLDEKEFLSPYGIRSLSKYHQDHPYVLNLNNHQYCIDYEPANRHLNYLVAILIGEARYGFL